MIPMNVKLGKITIDADGWLVNVWRIAHVTGRPIPEPLRPQILITGRGEL